MPIKPIFLVGKTLSDAEGQTAQVELVATEFVDFVQNAKTTLDIAIYHFRLGGAQGKMVLDALTAATHRGVQVRLAYFKEKPRNQGASITDFGADVGGPFDESQFEGSGVKLKAIEGIDIDHLPADVQRQPIEGGGHLMHSKYMVRDREHVWMGTANFTTEAWSVQDNNIVVFTGAKDLAGYYDTDFNELWDNGRIAGTGRNDSGSPEVASIAVDVDFSPGDGQTIDHAVAGLISGAKQSVHIASMVISSGAVLTALVEAIGRGVAITGVYDGPQMEGVKKDWARASKGIHGGASNGKLEQWAIVQEKLVAKQSKAFDPNQPNALYNFMHNKTLLVYAKHLLTGSFNFSENATKNAENIVSFIDPPVADNYVTYIEGLVSTYKNG